MDRLRALSNHLPSLVFNNRPRSIQHYGQSPVENPPSSTYQSPQFPPPHWSQAATAPNYGPPPVSEHLGIPTPQHKPVTEYQDVSFGDPNSPNPYGVGPATPVPRPERWTPEPLQLPRIIGVATFMILLAIGVEIAYFQSKRLNGFPISTKIDPGFLISFLPVLLVVPLTAFWKGTDHEILRIQPYITISQGNAPADRTVLIDYLNKGRIRFFLDSCRFGHHLVLISGIIALATAIFQPITAAVFVVRSTLYVMPNQQVASTSSLGLRPDFNDLTAFAAASGYVDAAVAHNLGDAPFIIGGWSVAQFDYKTVYNTVAKNGSLTVDTIATQTDTRCQPADQIAQQGAASSWTGTFEGCSASFTLQAADTAEANFGVVKVDNCTVNGSVPDDPFKPVMFWFYGDSGKVGMTFCSPTIEAFNVNATLTLFNNTLTKVNILSDYNQPSNVTAGPPLNGLALNGIFFAASNDKFTTARNTAIQSAVPGAIFRAAQNQDGGVDQVLSNQTFLASLTKKIYTQYLATAGQTNYFLPQTSTSPAVLTAWQPRIWMNSLATHAFAAVFILIGVASLVLHIRHTRERQWLFLAGPVGSIASAVSLTSSARFAGLLNAGDTEETLNQKLEGMYFGIDKDTWQIVVEKDERQQLMTTVDTGTSTPGEDEEKKMENGKMDHRVSVFGINTPSSPTVVGTMQHPTALIAEEIANSRSPRNGSFNIPPPSPSPYNPTQQNPRIYSPDV